MNTGKIFPESENVYQDEAKILFSYYRQAAEKIVAEEERIEHEIANLELERAQQEEAMGKLWVWFLTIILFFVYFIKKSKIEKNIASINERIAEFRKMHSEIFRDYAVTKLGVAYVPVAEQIRYEDRSFIVDHTGSVGESEVTLQQPRRNDLLVESMNRLMQLANEAPVVETSVEAESVETDEYSLSIQEVTQNDYLGAMERSLKTISFCMDDLETASVSLPLVLDHTPELQKINEFGTAELPQGSAVVEVFDDQRYAPAVEKFQQINQLKNSLSTETQQFEDVLKSLMVTIAGSVQAISALKVSSVDKVILESNKLLYQILKSPYNHYSPMLEYEEIERIRQEQFDFSDDVQGYEPFTLRQSSRVRYNPVSGMWTAEDGSVTSMPFGMHQLYEEIVAPVVQNLMAETRIERLKIYNHIKDQKLSYLTKWHQDTEAFYRANRAESADIINLMQESLRQYVAAYNTLVSLKRTEESMSQSNDLDDAVVESEENAEQSLLAFEMQSQEFQRTQTDFEDYMDRLKEDIDEKAARFGHVEYYDAKLRDGYSNQVATAASEVQDLDERRKDLASVNPLFAKASDLPPQPNVADITFEHISLNLPSIARNALNDLAAGAVEPEPTPVVEEPMVAEQPDLSEETVTPATPATPPTPPTPPTEPVMPPVPPVTPPVPPVVEEEEEEEEEYDDDVEEYDDDDVEEYDDDDDDIVYNGSDEDEDEDEDDEEDEEDEDDFVEISEESLNAMSDAEIRDLFEEVGLDVPQPYNREVAIRTLLEAADEEE